LFQKVLDYENDDLFRFFYPLFLL
jgi:hypothetical protein